MYGVILTASNLAMKTSSTTSKTGNSNENNQVYLEQIQWAREQILQKYRESIPDLLPVIELAIQTLTI